MLLTPRGPGAGAPEDEARSFVCGMRGKAPCVGVVERVLPIHGRPEQ
jgi:hypothetical protein